MVYLRSNNKLNNLHRNWIMTNMKELKEEATKLGISFSPNIGQAKLEDKIADKLAEEVEPIVDKVEVELAPSNEMLMDTVAVKGQERKLTMRQKAKIAEKLARKTSVIQIADNDSRENSHTTMCTVACGNRYFDLGLVKLPLNTAVEVQQGHIDKLKECRIPHYTRNSTTQMDDAGTRKRYTISYVQEAS